MNDEEEVGWLRGQSLSVQSAPVPLLDLESRSEGPV